MEERVRELGDVGHGWVVVGGRGEWEMVNATWIFMEYWFERLGFDGKH